MIIQNYQQYRSACEAWFGIDGVTCEDVDKEFNTELEAALKEYECRNVDDNLRYPEKFHIEVFDNTWSFRFDHFRFDNPEDTRDRIVKLIKSKNYDHWRLIIHCSRSPINFGSIQTFDRYIADKTSK